MILSATHIHTGPNTSLNVSLQLLDNQQDDPRALSTDSCRAQVAAGIVKAISQAIRILEESRFEVGVSRVQTGVCRRALYKDGSAQMYGDVHREDFCGMESRDGGPMQMLYCRRLRDGKLTGIAANIPCTAQCDEMALYVTADYMGVVRERLGETLGADVKLLGLIRSAGDLSPHQMVDRIPGLPRCHGHEGAVRTGHKDRGGHRGRAARSRLCHRARRAAHANHGAGRIAHLDGGRSAIPTGQGISRAPSGKRNPR